MKEIIKKRKRPCVLWIALLISQPFGLAHTKKERNSTLFQLPDRFFDFFSGLPKLAICSEFDYFSFKIAAEIRGRSIRPNPEGQIIKNQKAKN